MSSAALLRWMQARQHLVETYLTACFDSHLSAGSRLGDAMRYSTLDGGKRIRPLLLFASAECFGLKAEAVLPAACALELIHCYSLVHDDLPAMDDDALRRGKPSNHIQFDEATAILVGDGLQSLAFEQLAGWEASLEIKTALLQTLATASSAMALGQALDIQNCAGVSLSLADLQEIHGYKTGALMGAALAMGAQCAEESPEVVTTMQAIGTQIGLAFQVQDDVLDVTADSQMLGKPSGSDVKEGKTTYVSVLGVEKATAQVITYNKKITEQLAVLPENTEQLLALVQLMVRRAF